METPPGGKGGRVVRRPVWVHVACNDPDSGAWRGVAQALQVNRGGEAIDFDAQRTVQFSLPAEGVFRLGRHKYRFQHSGTWVGNWCWNVYQVEDPEAVRLLENIHRTGAWSCNGGLADACDYWDERDFAGVVRVLGAP